MIIKNAAFIFDFLTNKVSISTIFEETGVSGGQTALAGLVWDQSWTVKIQNYFGF